MRVASACAILVALSLAAYATWAQTRVPAAATSPATVASSAPTTGQSPAVSPVRAVTPVPATAQAQAPAPTLAAAPPPVAPLPTCSNPDALGLTRVVEIDTTKDRKSTRLNSSHLGIPYAVFC